MKSWDIISEILKNAAAQVKPGISTFDIDTFIEEDIKRLGATSINKGYTAEEGKFPYPNVSCISVNNQIAHGIPSKEVKLIEGDLVNIDLGITGPDNQVADAALSVPVGEISDRDALLLRYAKAALYAGIEVLKNGATVGDVARAVERKLGERDFFANRQLVGHRVGKGKELHLEPSIFFATNHNVINSEHYTRYEKLMDQKLETGMIVCLEPVVCFSDPFGFQDPNNGWTFYTRNGEKGAMFEHMIRILDDGYEVLTTHIKSWKEEQNKI